MFADKTIHIITPQIDLEMKYINNELICDISSITVLKNNIKSYKYNFELFKSFSGVYLQDLHTLRINDVPIKHKHITTNLKVDINEIDNVVKGIIDCVLIWYGRPVLFDTIMKEISNSKDIVNIDLDPISTVIKSQLNNNNAEITSYTKKIKPQFHGNGDRFYGLEIEVELLLNHRLYNKQNVMNILKNKFSDFVYFKDDKSITTYSENSLEIITHPATLGYHLEHTVKLLDVLKSCDCIATKNCGLHIHINKSAFGNGIEMCKNIGKFLKFEHKFHNQLVEFYGREDSSKIKLHCKKVLQPLLSDTLSNTTRFLLGNTNIYQDYDEDLEWFKTNFANTDRKMAINLLFNPTVEFRLPQGTLDVSTFVKYIEKLDTILNSIIYKKDVDIFE